MGQPTPRCLSEKGRQLGLAGWLCWGLPKHVKFSFLCHFTVLLTDPYVRAGVWCSFGYTHGQGVWDDLGGGLIGAVLQERLGLGRGVLVAEIFWNLKILCHSSPSEPTATHMFTTSSGPVCELAEPSCMNEARGTVATCFGWWFYDSSGAGFWELREKFQKLVSTQI